MALYIEIKAADGMVSRTRLETGKNRFTVRLGDSYRIVDDQTGLTPEGLAVKRVDNNLVVDGLERDATTVEFADFYSVCSAGSPCELAIDNGSGSAPIAITPGTQPIGALADGAFVLYDPDFAENAPAAPSFADGAIVRNVMYGIGGLAIVGLAAGGGGGGGGGEGGGGTRPDGTLKLTSSEFVNSRTPNLTGEGEPGARVTIRIDTDGNGSPDVTYVTTVGADFKWSVNLATAIPESGALPAGGIPDTSNVGITATSSGGIVSLPTFALVFDGTPPAPAAIDAVTPDNVVNASEKTNGVVISGSAEAGTVVILSLNGQPPFATRPVDANGHWETVLSAASVPADGQYALSVVVQDRAGNSSTPTQLAVTVNTAPAALTLATGNEQINGAEAASGITFQGQTDPNGTIAVVWNGVAKPAVTADGSGVWSVGIAPGEIPAGNGSSVPYSIAATNLIGNTAALSGQATVDTVAPTVIAINPVTGDNLVTTADNPAGGITVTGTATEAGTVSVTWGTKVATGTAGANGIWTAVFASGNLPADGTHSLSVVATDAAGNQSAPVALPAVVVDVTPPPLEASAVSIDNFVNAAEAPGGVTFSGTTEAGATVSVNWGGNILPGVVNGAGGWSTAAFPVPPNTVPTGAVVPATILATDTHGNVSQLTHNVTVDLVGPNAATAVVVDMIQRDNVVETGQSFAVGGDPGSAEAGSSVTVTIGLASQTVVAGADGSWTTTATFVGGVPGPGSATVTVTDTAQNAAVKAFPFTVVFLGGGTAPPDLISVAALTSDQVAGSGDSAFQPVAMDSVAAGFWSAAQTTTALVPLEPYA